MELNPSCNENNIRLVKRKKNVVHLNNKVGLKFKNRDNDNCSKLSIGNWIKNENNNFNYGQRNCDEDDKIENFLRLTPDDVIVFERNNYLGNIYEATLQLFNTSIKHNIFFKLRLTNHNVIQLSTAHKGLLLPKKKVEIRFWLDHHVEISLINSSNFQLLAKIIQPGTTETMINWNENVSDFRLTGSVSFKNEKNSCINDKQLLNLKPTSNNICCRSSPSSINCNRQMVCYENNLKKLNCRNACSKCRNNTTNTTIDCCSGEVTKNKKYDVCKVINYRKPNRNLPVVKATCHKTKTCCNKKFILEDDVYSIVRRPIISAKPVVCYNNDYERKTMDNSTYYNYDNNIICTDENILPPAPQSKVDYRKENVFLRYGKSFVLNNILKYFKNHFPPKFNNCFEKTSATILYLSIGFFIGIIFIIFVQTFNEEILLKHRIVQKHQLSLQNMLLGFLKLFYDNDIIDIQDTE